MGLMKRLAWGLLSLAVLLPAWSQAAAEAGKDGGRDVVRVLVITGGHGYDENVFPSLFESAESIEATFVDSGDQARPFDRIEDWSYDAIVLYNFNQKLTRQQRENFMTLLENGTGLVVLHHAIHAYPGWSAYPRLIGGGWVTGDTFLGKPHKKSTYQHGEDITITVADRDHPVTRGVAGQFEIHDETYKRTWKGEDRHVLLTTDHPGSDEALGWTRTPGEKRIVYLQPGQGPSVFKHPQYRRLVAQAIHWTVESQANDGDEKESR
jgi:type 1 glutamine amidotransferase